jgi:hypothetical protein
MNTLAESAQLKMYEVAGGNKDTVYGHMLGSAVLMEVIQGQQSDDSRIDGEEFERIRRIRQTKKYACVDINQGQKGDEVNVGNPSGLTGIKAFCNADRDELTPDCFQWLVSFFSARAGLSIAILFIYDAKVVGLTS